MRRKCFNKITSWFTVICMLAGMAIMGSPVTSWAEEVDGRPVAAEEQEAGDEEQSGASQIIRAITNLAGTAVILFFDQPMADPSSMEDQFDVIINGEPRDLSAAALHPGDDTRIDLTLTSPANCGDRLMISYHDRSIVSASNRQLEPFDKHDVINYIPSGNRIHAGKYHSLAIKANGTVGTWGASSDGLGSVPVDLNDAVDLASGRWHSLALKADGRVAFWGWTDSNNASLSDVSSLRDVAAIAAGHEHALALKSDGTVVAWGRNAEGQCNIPESVSEAVAITAGYWHSLAIKPDGNVTAWGWNDNGQCSVPEGLSDVVAVAGGYSHSLALKSDGTVAAWGNNDNGQCSVPDGLRDVVAIAAGGWHSLALKADGTVATWGMNWDNQCTVLPELSNVAAISAGWYHSMALKSDGSVVASGAPRYDYNWGQCGVPAGLNLSGRLSGLQLENGYLAPDFDPDKTNYILTVDPGADSLEVTATLENDSYVLLINGEAAESGVAETVTLREDQNAIPITVATPGTRLARLYTLMGDIYVYSGWLSNPNQSVIFPDGTVMDGTQPGAYSTIRAGVENVQDGWTVHIADGSYTGPDNRNITIEKNIIISGHSRDHTVIDAGQAGRIFTITGNASVTIRNLTLSNGISEDGGAVYVFDGSALNIRECIFTDNRGTRNGGAINNSGSLTVTGTAFTGNSAKYGGAVYFNINTINVTDCVFENNHAYRGGAVFNWYGGALNIGDSAFTNNSATAAYGEDHYAFGGAICQNAGALTITDTSFTDNSGYLGGAVYNDLGRFAITGSTFTNNSADRGGALYNWHGTNLSVNNSAFQDNSAIDNFGGAIYTWTGEFAINNTSFTNNTAPLDGATVSQTTANGGAITNDQGRMTIVNCVFDRNQAQWCGAVYNGSVEAVLIILNSIFTDNYANESGGAIYNYGDMTIDGSKFIGNRARWSGSAIFNNQLSSLKVRESVFEDNNSYWDSAIYVANGTCEVRFNSFMGIGHIIRKSDESCIPVNAENNWWGANLEGAGPATEGKVHGINISTWMVLTASASPANTRIGRTSSITADFLYDNLGNYHDPASGHVPDGIPVTFAITDGQTLGSLGSPNSTTVNGRAASAFTASAMGTANFTMSADNQQASAQITIGPASRKTKVNLSTVDENGRITAAAALNRNIDTATTEIYTSILATALERVAENSDGVKTVQIVLPAVQGAKAYESTLPASTLNSSGTGTEFVIKTGFASVTLPGDMLDPEAAAGAEKVSLTVAQSDASDIDNEDTKNRIGGRPVIRLSMKLDGKPYEWSNEDSPVTVSIPYKPITAELADPEHITVWYLDGKGEVVEVPSGRYDPATGTVTFSTTHFSKFAVVHVTKTFDDLRRAAWAKKPIEVLASKGILKGISEAEYAPQTNITRADFLYYLIRTLGVDAKVDGNFEDIDKDAYYYRETAIAKKLGITGGTGNNKFTPDAGITRQDMMVMTERALRMLKKLETQSTAADLDQFADKSLVAAYAVNSIASVVKEGLITGSGGKVNPRGNTTRAEAAVFLYRIYNK